MPADYLIRRDQRHQRAGEQLCECGHQLRAHAELPAVTYAIEGGTIVSKPNAAYRPLHFHCDGCDCVRVPS